MSTVELPEAVRNRMKRVVVQDVVYLLKNGYTRWNADIESTGAYGSIQGYYDLSHQEAKQLFAHPKVKGVTTYIPSLLIIDNEPDAEVMEFPEENVEEPTEEEEEEGGLLDQEFQSIVQDLAASLNEANEPTPAIAAVEDVFN